MLSEPTREKLMELRLRGMAGAWSAQQADPQSAQLAFDERFGLLVDAEWMERHNKRLARALREAQLRIRQACIEDLQASAPRGLEKALVRQLATCEWIHSHQNLVITGACGVGKTYVACALAHQACRKGYRSLYRRVPRLFEELLLARADGSYARLLARIARFDVLVLDDWGLTPLDDLQRRDLLEIFEDRYGQRSTIVLSQLPTERWHDHIGEPTIADAICDRLLHNAHRLKLRGPSRRRPENAQDSED
jgi:DNA replication protein DnaC